MRSEPCSCQGRHRAHTRLRFHDVLVERTGKQWEIGVRTDWQEKTGSELQFWSLFADKTDGVLKPNDTLGEKMMGTCVKKDGHEPREWERIIHLLANNLENIQTAHAAQ